MWVGSWQVTSLSTGVGAGEGVLCLAFCGPCPRLQLPEAQLDISKSYPLLSLELSSRRP